MRVISKIDEQKECILPKSEEWIIASQPLDYDNAYDFSGGIKVEHGIEVAVTEEGLKEIQNNQYIKDKFTLDIKKFGNALWWVAFKDKNVQDNNEVEGILTILA